MPQYLNPPGACPAQGLYSHVAKTESGPLYFVAGQLAVGDRGEVVGKDSFADQFHRVFDNLDSVLKGLGRSFGDVIKFTTYLTSADDIPHFMELRAARFPKLFRSEPYPPNTMIVIQRLVKPEFKLEIEAVVQG